MMPHIESQAQRDALIEHIKGCLAIADRSPSKYPMVELTHRIALAALENHIADAGKMMGWVKCSESTPSPDDYVMVKIAYGGIHLAWYRDGGWVQDKEHCDSSGYISSVIKDRVTHWQPLPEAPHD